MLVYEQAVSLWTPFVSAVSVNFDIHSISIRSQTQLRVSCVFGLVLGVSNLDIENGLETISVGNCVCPDTNNSGTHKRSVLTRLFIRLATANRIEKHFLIAHLINLADSTRLAVKLCGSGHFQGSPHGQ